MTLESATKSITVTPEFEKVVENILHDKLAHMLEDISFRIGQEYELKARNAGQGRGTVYAEDLNLPGRALLTGYTVTNNSPAAGSFAWADLHVVYNGVDHTITNGSTANKFVWWSSTVTPTVLQTGPTKPTLANGEVLLFMNINGTPQVMLSDTNASMPGVLRDGAVDSTSILANAVTTAAIAGGAVTTTQLGPNAVTSTILADSAISRATQLQGNVVTSSAIADNAVGAAAIAANAVTSTELANNAVVRADQLGLNVVTSTKIADGAVSRADQLGANVVTTTQIADNAVTGTELIANAVTSAKLADNAIVRSTQMTANVVGTTEIKPSAVTSAELATGAVSPTKLNILRHIIF